MTPRTMIHISAIVTLSWISAALLSCNPVITNELDQDGDDYVRGIDCDDTNPAIHPGATEIAYNGVDEDCSGGDAVDLDGDGVSAVEIGGEDCNDKDGTVYPGALEVCDGQDNGCDSGYIDDLDQDGYMGIDCEGEDCDDSDEAIHPGATELPYDGIDQDCSGADLVDVDGDGEIGAVVGGPDCDDEDANIGFLTEIFIPAGTFVMGQEWSGSPDAPADASPPHEVTLKGYCIDRYEVSNNEYAACQKNSACSPPQSSDSYTRDEYYDNPDYVSYPVVQVNWNMARQYCRYVGKDLPTEAQWEKAARGGLCLDGDSTCQVDNEWPERFYPWGTYAPHCGLANYDPAQESACVGDTNDVSSGAGGRSPYGVINLSGNVSEWVLDVYQADYYEDAPSEDPTGPGEGDERVIRGGAFWDTAERIDITLRSHQVKETSSRGLGFRCGRTITTLSP